MADKSPKKLDAKKNPSEADEERFSDLEDRIFELDRERPEVYTPEQMAIHTENKEIVARIVQKWRRYKFLSEADQRRLMAALR